MKIGHIMKLVRTNKGLTQNEMAGLFGISQNYLSLIESNKKIPSNDKLAHFSKTLNVSKEAFRFIASEVPKELSNEDKEEFNRLQNNVFSLLLFELSGEFKKIA